MLESIGYSVAIAKDGEEAVKKIREIDPRVKAVVCSGYSGDTVMANYRKYGFGGVVPKPYSLKCLSETLCEVLSAPA